MELGTLQKAWVQSLREHPERQINGKLGTKTSDGYYACCLGEALCVLARAEGKELPFLLNGVLEDINEENGEKSMMYPRISFTKIGLINDEGTFFDNSTPTQIDFFSFKFNSLAEMNDDGVSWGEIADVIEKYAEKLFSESL